MAGVGSGLRSAPWKRWLPSALGGPSGAAVRTGVRGAGSEGFAEHGEQGSGRYLLLRRGGRQEGRRGGPSWSCSVTTADFAG